MFCEFCHKIGDVTLDPATQLPYSNMPGVLSLRLYRPEEGEQLFFGNFDDVTRRVSYLPLEEESAFCAPCHFGDFWGTVVYDSCGEWLRSPYSDPETGHHVPTDSPLRHLILLVQATDGDSNSLTQLDGPTVPKWGGVGDPEQGPALSAAEGYYARLPGTAFAKILEETWTQISPSGAYWNPTRILSDNRIAAFETDTGIYTFAAPEEGQVDVQVTLIFRRAFIELVDQKDWDAEDIVMEEASVTLSVQPWRSVFLPWVVRQP